MGILINGKEHGFTPGETVLQVAKRAGINIPHLCSLDWSPSPAAACRLCLVEVDGTPRLQTSCTLEAKDGMSVQTHSPRVLASRRTIVELLVANHPRDCLACRRSDSCELLSLSSELGVRKHRYSGKRKAVPIDVSSPSIMRDPNKCVLCGRCVTICQTVQAVGAIDFVGRGFRTHVAPGFHAGLNTSTCVYCGQCVRACPTGALLEKNHVDEVVAALADRSNAVVVQLAPAVPATVLAKENVPVRTVLRRLASALRAIGFEAVFDTTFAADLTILEEVSELVRRIKESGPLPMFTSCSPAWVRYVETQRPDLIPHMSTCKSPQQMAGALIKRVWPKEHDLGGRRLVSVAIMPCTAKKAEADELGDIDYVLTTRELEELLERFGVALERHGAEEPLDSPFAAASGAGRLFGGSGGVMEAAIRTAHKVLTGEDMSPSIREARGMEGIRRLSVDAGGISLNFAIVNGLGQLGQLGELRDLHFVEVMTCPGGCVGGGGQPYDTDIESVRERIAKLQESDRRSKVRGSHANEEVQALYETVLGEPLSHASHSLLHRGYTDRSMDHEA